MNLPILATVFEVFYLSPYSQEERSQLYASKDEAERMQVYYESCGSPSHIKERTLNKLS
jgi:hypothetical protein